MRRLQSKRKPGQTITVKDSAGNILVVVRNTGRESSTTTVEASDGLTIERDERKSIDKAAQNPVE